MNVLFTAGLFALTALAEIIGCYLPYLWLQKGKSPWLLVPASLSRTDGTYSGSRYAWRAWQ